MSLIKQELETKKRIGKEKEVEREGKKSKKLDVAGSTQSTLAREERELSKQAEEGPRWLYVQKSQREGLDSRRVSREGGSGLEKKEKGENELGQRRATTARPHQREVYTHLVCLGSCEASLLGRAHRRPRAESNSSLRHLGKKGKDGSISLCSSNERPVDLQNDGADLTLRKEVRFEYYS